MAFNLILITIVGVAATAQTAKKKKNVSFLSVPKMQLEEILVSKIKNLLNPFLNCHFRNELLRFLPRLPQISVEESMMDFPAPNFMVNNHCLECHLQLRFQIKF